MNIFPAIDLYSGKAVRLYKGRYEEMTVYSDNPPEIAEDFIKAGAAFMHVVDLEGARSGGTPNIETIKRLAEYRELFVEVGGGIRSMQTIDAYLSSGVDRVILGTAAITDEAFLNEAVKEFGEAVAVGADLKDGCVAIKGWTEKTDIDARTFFGRMENLGVSTIICTDISKDGAMAGTNHSLYRELAERTKVNIIASGGVSALEDVIKLRELGIYGAIIGKAYYTGAINLKEAIEAAR